jgi:hypothetical protein
MINLKAISARMSPIHTNFLTFLPTPLVEIISVEKEKFL